MNGSTSPTRPSSDAEKRRKFVSLTPLFPGDTHGSTGRGTTTSWSTCRVQTAPRSTMCPPQATLFRWEIPSGSDPPSSGSREMRRLDPEDRCPQNPLHKRLLSLQKKRTKFARLPPKKKSFRRGGAISRQETRPSSSAPMPGRKSQAFFVRTSPKEGLSSKRSWSSGSWLLEPGSFSEHS